MQQIKSRISFQRRVIAQRDNMYRLRSAQPFTINSNAPSQNGLLSFNSRLQRVKKIEAYLGHNRITVRSSGTKSSISLSCIVLELYEQGREDHLERRVLANVRRATSAKWR